METPVGDGFRTQRLRAQVVVQRHRSVAQVLVHEALHVVKRGAVRIHSEQRGEELCGFLQATRFVGLLGEAVDFLRVVR
jgi:hypothetical protein